MDYDPSLYNQGAADVLGPMKQLISILHQHLAAPLDPVEDENGYVLQCLFAAL